MYRKRDRIMHYIMIVDDEENILKSLKRVLNKYNDLEVDIFTDIDQALKRAQTKNYDLFISDYRMPQMDGIEFLSQVKDYQPDSMRFILSGYTDLEALLGAINKANIYRFISKPWQDYDLIETIRQALKQREVLRENKYLAEKLKEQEEQISNHKKIMEDFQTKHPDLFKVNWSDDGSITINDNDL